MSMLEIDPAVMKDQVKQRRIPVSHNNGWNPELRLLPSQPVGMWAHLQLILDHGGDEIGLAKTGQLMGVQNQI
jgi:hypothetical protein